MKKIMVVLVVLVLAFSAGSAFATIAGSRHDMTNLTAHNYGGQGDPCLHCHTPHGSSGEALWNRTDGTVSQQTSTKYGTKDLDPRGSQLCMGCHDGSIANSLVNAPGRGNATSPTYDMTNIFKNTGNTFAMLGNSAAALGNNHPLGVPVTAGAGMQVPAAASFPMYDGSGSTTSGTHVECATCHDPHAGNGDVYNGFLRAGFACSVCHIK